jgi:hypothetical protein
MPKKVVAITFSLLLALWLPLLAAAEQKDVFVLRLEGLV